MDEKCVSCGILTDVHVGQAIEFGDQLVWSRGVSCSCGYTVEEDGMGLPPARYRDAILAQDGVWSVTVEEPSKATTVALVLKEALGVDRRAALKIAKTIPGQVWTGSAAEVQWLRRLLAARGVVARCGRMSAAKSSKNRR